MAAILTDLSTPALITAIEDNIVALNATLQTVPGAEHFESSDLHWTLTGAPAPTFNTVSRTRFSTNEADARIAATLAQFKARSVPMTWFTGPSSSPSDLGQRLLAHGLTHASDDPGMALDLRTLPEPAPLPRGLVIERARDMASLRIWSNIAEEANSERALDPLIERILTTCCLGDGPPVRCYLATLDGVPAATSLWTPGAGVAGVYAVATVPRFRRRGLGTAVTLAPLYDARAEGYRAAVLEASEMGHPVYLRIGFRAYCTIGFYSWSPDQ